MISLPQLPASRAPVQDQSLFRDHLSYSEISTFQRCSLQWWYRYVEKVEPEFISAALVLGSATHAAIEHYLQCKMAALPTPSMDALDQIVQDRWKREADYAPIRLSKTQSKQALFDTAHRMLEAFSNSEFAQGDADVIGLEESFETMIDHDLPNLKGVVDLLTFADGVLTVTDFKTARSMWTTDTLNEKSDQLTLYGKGCQSIADELDAELKLRFVVITKHKSPQINAIEVSIDNDRVNRTRTVIRQVYRLMRAGVVVPSPSAMNCSSCPYQSRCQSWHR